MILTLHIVLALASIVYAAYLYLRPSRGGLYAGYSLTAATLFSGAYLVVSTRSPIMPACTAGLIYLGVVLAGLLAASRRLARQN